MFRLKIVPRHLIVQDSGILNWRGPGASFKSFVNPAENRFRCHLYHRKLCVEAFEP